MKSQINYRLRLTVWSLLLSNRVKIDPALPGFFPLVAAKQNVFVSARDVTRDIICELSAELRIV